MADQSTYASVNETARQHFEAAWRDGKSARIEEHLPSPDDPRYLATLEELVHIELEMKWKAQHADDATAVATIAVPRVEEYLVRFPRLNEPIIVLRLLKQEYRVRHLYGDQPAASEYRDRFPQIVIEGREVETRMPKRTSDALPQLDGYEVLEELGHGGMGVVYKARQIGLDRIVALKMIRAGASANEEDRVRFQVEAEASAQLRHPNIVQIYEVGDKDGLPFFSLEFVEGGSLDRALSGNPQEPRDAATLIETLARAMHYAHEQGVIHRDLKPANVLLQIADRIMQNESTPQSAIGNLQSAIPKITDFGLAKRLEADSKQTQTGAVLGTPSYMAPEQATAKKDIGPAADIYALGAILYEMLTGRPPFRGPSAWDTLNQVVHDEPVPPSQLQPTVPRDLETICLKCLMKDPARRYGTAAELADDLARFLRDEPIVARPISTAERMLKAARRRPLVTGLIAGVIVVGVLGLAGIFWQWREAEGQRDLAEKKAESESRARKDERRAREDESKARQGMEKALLDETAARTAAEAALVKEQAQLYFHRIFRADREWHAFNVRGADRLLEECRAESRHWEWSLLKWRCNSHLHVVPEYGTWVAYSPNGKHLAVGSHRTAICDADTGRRLRTLEAFSMMSESGAYAPDGRFLAVAASQKTVAIWDPESGKHLINLEGHDEWIRVAVSPNGKRLAAASSIFGVRGSVKLWDTETWKEIKTIGNHANQIVGVAFNPGGSRLATASWDGTVKVWEIDTGKEVHSLPHLGASAVAFSPDNKFLFAGSADGAITVWDADKATHLGRMHGHRATIQGFAFSPTAPLLASASYDKTVGIWNWQNGQNITALRGHSKAVQGVAFSVDGKRITSAGGEQVKIWDASTNQWGHQFFTDDVNAFAFHANGKRLATASTLPGKAITLWDVANRKSIAALAGHSAIITDLAISPNDDLLAAAGADGTIRVWDLATEKPIAAFSEHAESSVVCIAFSPDSAWIASGTAEWFKKTPKKAQEPPAGAEKPKLIEPFPPGAFDFRLIPAEIKVWEARTGKLIRGWNLDAEYSAQRVVFGSTPESLAVALNLRKIRAALGKHLPVSQLKIFETRTGTAVVAIAPHSDPIDGLALDPRAKRIAAASQDRTVTVFEESTGKILHTLVGHAAPVRSVSFSHDGKRLASADSDGTVKLWDPATGVEVLHVGLAGQTLESIRFSPDGRTLAVIGVPTAMPGRRGLWIWQVPPY